MHLHKTKPLPTHQRVKEPIDGIFLSPSLLEGAKEVYLAFDDGMESDHWGIWLDIQAFKLFSGTLQQYTPANAR